MIVSLVGRLFLKYLSSHLNLAMPRTKSQLSRLSLQARRMRYKRSLEDYEQRQQRLLKNRLRLRAIRQRSNDQSLNRNIIAAAVVEVTIQEDNSDEEDLDKQNKDESSKKQKEKTNQNDTYIFCGATRLDNDSEGICCLRAELKIEQIDTVEEPLDCHIEEGKQ